MFAIAFDLVVRGTETHHPKGVSQAYTDIGNTLDRFGFRRIQGSVYVSDTGQYGELIRGDHGAEGIAVVSSFRTRHSCLQDRAVV